MENWVSVAAKITNEYALAAYTIAALLTGFSFLGRQKLKGKPWLLALVVVAIVSSAVMPLVSKVILTKLQQPYRIGVLVFEPDGSQAIHPAVSANVPYNAYEIQNAIQLEIDNAHVPKSGRLTILAKDVPNNLENSTDMVLSADRNPTVSIKLIAQPADISGNVLDSNNNGIVGVRVSVVGDPDWGTTTDAGYFVIHSHASKGTTVYLLAEKSGFQTVKQQTLVGAVSTITIEPIPAKNRTRKRD
jgi:hypothetical protein